MTLPEKHSKAWYCHILNISIDTFRKWIEPVEPALNKKGYNKHQQIFTPGQRKIINEHLDITEEEYNKRA